MKIKGFALVQLLLVLAILTFTAGGVMVWQKKKISPTPTPTPISNPTPQVFPKASPTTPVNLSQCKTDNDCQAGYWCRKGPGGPMAGGEYGGSIGRCFKECQTDYDCGAGAFCQNIQFFEGDVGMGYRKGCQTNPDPNPKQKITFPTQYSCSSDSDCVIKNRPYCCGESLEYYKWCYHKNVEPETISCEGVGSCPGIAPATSCVCQNGKCTAIF